jgi:hypothetical protein
LIIPIVAIQLRNGFAPRLYHQAIGLLEKKPHSVTSEANPARAEETTVLVLSRSKIATQPISHVAQEASTDFIF